MELTRPRTKIGISTTSGKVRIVQRFLEHQRADRLRIMHRFTEGLAEKTRRVFVVPRRTILRVPPLPPELQDGYDAIEAFEHGDEAAFWAWVEDELGWSPHRNRNLIRALSEGMNLALATGDGGAFGGVSLRLLRGSLRPHKALGPLDGPDPERVARDKARELYQRAGEQPSHRQALDNIRQPGQSRRDAFAERALSHAFDIWPGLPSGASLPGRTLDAVRDEDMYWRNATRKTQVVPVVEAFARREDEEPGLEDATGRILDWHDEDEEEEAAREREKAVQNANLDQFLHVLSRREQQVRELRRLDRDDAEIEAELGITNANLRQIESRMTRKLKRARAEALLGDT